MLDGKKTPGEILGFNLVCVSMGMCGTLLRLNMFVFGVCVRVPQIKHGMLFVH